jgi:hypothetical protein
MTSPVQDDPLYDEDDTTALPPFPRNQAAPVDGWELMVRMPLKKKLMAERYWKQCYLRLLNNTIFVYANKKDDRPIHELPLMVKS